MFELELRCTLVENACGALCRQVLRGRACEAEENLPAKCTDCSFNLNVNDELVKYPNAKLARRGVLGIPPSYIYICTVYFCPKVVNASFYVTMLLWKQHVSSHSPCHNNQHTNGNRGAMGGAYYIIQYY